MVYKINDVFDQLEIVSTSSHDHKLVIIGKIKGENAIIVVKQPTLIL